MNRQTRCPWSPGLVAVALAVVCSAPAAADIVQLSAILDGASANAGTGTGSPGTGSASMTLDTDTDEFSWEIAWSGLQGDETIMHFHGPALPDQNAGVQVDFGSISGTMSPSIGSTTITAQQVSDLLNELWYINIHTTEFAAGEIRGQVMVIPEPSTCTLLICGALALLACRRRRWR